MIPFQLNSFTNAPTQNLQIFEFEHLQMLKITLLLPILHRILTPLIIDAGSAFG
jgi:hypothetical protein